VQSLDSLLQQNEFVLKRKLQNPALRF